jgi:hypothetical protein
MDWSEEASSAFDVAAAEFVVATPEGADRDALARLSALLRRVRGAFGVDAVFVSEWVQDEPLVRTNASAAGGPNVLHALYGMQLLAGAGGCFDAVPVVSAEGVEYGTLCCRRRAPEAADSPLPALQSVAALIARWFDAAGECVAA